MKNKEKFILYDNKNEFEYSKSKSDINIKFNRVAFIFFVFFIISVIYSIHLIHLASRKSDDLNNNQIKTFNKLKRADIVDNNGNFLARTVSSIDIGINPTEVIDQKKLLLNLGYIFPNKDYKLIKSKFEQNKFFWFEKKISDENYEKIMMLGDKSIKPKEKLTRVYPQKNLFSHIIGQIDNDIGGHIVALKWTMKNIYNIDEGDIWWSASDIGWIVGHSYIVYAPLFKGCTTVLFEGKPVGTPDAGAFWKIISDYKVKSLFTAPTAFRAIKKEDPEGKFFSKYDLSKFKSLFLAGERADPDTIKWAENLLKVPVIDHWWQTETSWAISSNCTGIEMMQTKYGSACKAVPGYDVKIIKSDLTLAKPNEMGDIVVKLPLPPGTFPTLWNADKRYKENYMSNYKGYYQTYDAGHIDEDGYIWIMSRTDDIINVAGHRLSTGAIEEVLSEHQSVAECAVLGVADKLKGQLPIGLIVLKAGVDKDNDTISKECIQMVRNRIGPVAAFKVAIVIKRLPKTRSGKILRGTIRKIADKAEYKIPPTIDDPTILDEIKEDLVKNSILKSG